MDSVAERLMNGLDELTLLDIRRRLRALRAATKAEAVLLLLGELIVERSGDWRCAPSRPFRHIGGAVYDRGTRHTVICHVRIPKQRERYQLLVVNPAGIGDDDVLARMHGTKEELETLIVARIARARSKKR